MLKAKTRWKKAPFNQEKVDLITNGLHISPLVAHLLVNRGYDTIETANSFLNTNEQQFFDPFLLDDMGKAVDRIKHAIANNERILIFGDYDADGVSSTTVILTALQSLGADVDFYIPNRFTEGYGPNKDAFKWAKSAGFSVIITVDTGIAAIEEARLASDLGIDLIITDHHEVGPIIPEAFAIIHPKKPGSDYPYKDLAGAGVALKLAHGLLGECPKSLIEIAAIGTVADLVPLTGENRLIAKKGIEQLKQTTRPGLKALFKLSSVESSKINEETIGFTIAPRINAVGRLDSADPAVHLLMATDPDEARDLASLIDSLNKERQKIVTDMAEEAMKEIEENFPLETNQVLVVAKEGWNTGVVGIVASRIVDRYDRPAIVLSIDQETGLAKGSARSIVGFDLFKHLSTCRDILPHFGGHTMAAGMTLNASDIQDLRNRLIHCANEVLTEADYTKWTNIDVDCQIDEITLETIEQIGLLAPFGMCNPKPKVLVSNINMANIRKIGSNQTHLKITFERAGNTLDSVGFGFGYLYNEISPLATIDVVGDLSINEWNNFRKPQMFIQDVAINEWQLFDFRGAKDIKKVLTTIPNDTKRKLIVFKEETLKSLELSEYKKEIILILNNEMAKNIDLSDSYVVFVDLPPSKEMVESLLTPHFPERVYPIFFNDQNHFFSTIPTREHFKWYYAFLAKKGPFDLKKNAHSLASYRGWSIETIDFMSQVFFELNFVKIENGLISLSNHAHKRDLEESETYQMKQMQLELENMYLYSSYQQLKQCFDEMEEKEVVLT